MDSCFTMYTEVVRKICKALECTPEQMMEFEHNE